MTENTFTGPTTDPGPGAAPSAGWPHPDATAGATSAPAGGYPPPWAVPRPPLLRSRSDRMLGGVCGGVARTLGADPSVVRLLAILLAVVTGGAAVLGYLIAWVVIPAEDPWIGHPAGAGAWQQPYPAPYATPYAGPNPAADTSTH